MATVAWPIVCNDDPGIRPAGKPDRCFYCKKKIGEPHGNDCVMVSKRILMRIESTDGSITGSWEFASPYSFSPETEEYMKNDGTWCANNVFDSDEIVWDQPDALVRLKLKSEDKCLCDELRFEFVRVVDDTPRVVDHR